MKDLPEYGCCPENIIEDEGPWVQQVAGCIRLPHTPARSRRRDDFSRERNTGLLGVKQRLSIDQFSPLTIWFSVHTWRNPKGNGRGLLVS